MPLIRSRHVSRSTDGTDRASSIRKKSRLGVTRALSPSTSWNPAAAEPRGSAPPAAAGRTTDAWGGVPRRPRRRPQVPVISTAAPPAAVDPATRKPRRLTVCAPGHSVTGRRPVAGGSVTAAGPADR